MKDTTRRPRTFVLYRDSALRRDALREPLGARSRYSLYGLDELAADGLDVHHNLESAPANGLGPRIAAGSIDRALRLAGGYSGDFGSVLACRRELNGADVVFSTVDTVGIPVTLLSRTRIVRTPIVYAAIGLPERVEQLEPRANRAYRSAFRRLDAILAYGWGEVDALREWLGEGAPRVEFVPFGVDTEAFLPAPEIAPETDVVSVGADQRRDYALLLTLAERRADWTFHVVASSDHADEFASVPQNVRVELDLPFEQAYARLRAGRVVVLPVRENSYSGGTTVLLHALATGKPVVVSRTAAIARGYHLEDGLNCRLVAPGALSALEGAVSDLLGDRDRAAAVGSRARETAEQHLGWRRYTTAVRELLLAAATRAPGAR